MRKTIVVFLLVLTLLLLLSSELRFAQAPSYLKVCALTAKLMIDSNPSLIVLDVRTQYEYDWGHIRNAHLIPEEELMERLDELDKNRPIIVYCQYGESDSACEALVACGFEQVYAILGGITAWINAGYPVFIRPHSLQEVINNATPGDTIRVSIGNYTENITIDKPITLEGENKTTTIINNNYTTYHTININANNIQIHDFTIKNGYYAVFCLQTFCANLTLQNNIIHGNKIAGIALYGTKHFVSNNTIINNGFGIILGSKGNNTIAYNVIKNNSGSGIELRNSKNNKIHDNYLANNSLGIRFYTYSHNNIICKNTITNCSNGISLHDSCWNYITQNSIRNNAGIGLSLLNSHNNTITKNDVGYNINKGFFITNSNNNTFYHNNITNNTLQLENKNSSNNWDNGFLEGNYWSDYTGQDLNGDGIGDTLIPWQTVDSYPLISPHLDGDCNHDGKVDQVDVERLQSSWLSIYGESKYNPHVDFNMDRIVNIIDATVMGFNWLRHGEILDTNCQRD